MASPPTDAREALIVKLAELFRQRGFEGVSIADIAAATGIGRSSLYHHFPGGKEEMAEAVIAFARHGLERSVFAALAGDGPVTHRIEAMLEAARRIYADGADPCVLAAFLTGAPGDPLAQAARGLIETWTAALANALASGGASPREAQRRARAMLTLLQGGLVMSRALQSTEPFLESLDLGRAMLSPER